MTVIGNLYYSYKSIATNSKYKIIGVKKIKTRLKAKYSSEIKSSCPLRLSDWMILDIFFLIIYKSSISLVSDLSTSNCLPYLASNFF